MRKWPLHYSEDFGKKYILFSRIIGIPLYEETNCPCSFTFCGNNVCVSRYMSKKFVKEGKMSVDFMREKEKMLTLLGRKRNKKQSKNKVKSQKRSSSKEKRSMHENQKRPHEEETADSSGLELKRMKVDTDGTSLAFTGGELASQEEPPSSVQTAVIEQKIETQILEDMEDVLGVKE
jgi:hypothetical protein